MYFITITAMFITTVYYIYLLSTSISKRLYDDDHKLVDHG